MGVFKNNEKKATFAFPQGVDIDEVNSKDEFINAGAGADKKNRNLSGAKLGRPKKDKNEKKLCLVHMYITQEEKTELQKRADEMHMSLSSYLKFVVFQSKQI